MSIFVMECSITDSVLKTELQSEKYPISPDKEKRPYYDTGDY